MLRVAVASDGTMAAVHEPTRVSVVELPGCDAFAEVEIARDAGTSEVAWIGAPPRLFVLSRYANHAIAHLVDPYGPRTVAELRIDEPVRLSGVVGAHALLLGAHAATVVTATDSALAAYAFPARGGVPAVAGGGAHSFVVVLPGMLEEWDPQARIPRKRIKLPHTGAVAAVGGSDRLAWCTWQDERRRVDALPLGRGQPKTHELPESIAEVAAHPHSTLLACVGAESGRIYVIDLDGLRGMRIVGPTGIDRAETVGLVIGRAGGVLAAQARRPIAFVALDHTPVARRETGPRETVVPIDGPATTVSLSPIDGPATAVSLAPSFADGRDWRFELVEWARAAIASAGVAARPPAAPPVARLIARLELATSLHSVVALLYGLYLAGHDGAAPVDVARVALGWDEALGRGELAARAVVVHERARIKLAPAVLKALDEA